MRLIWYSENGELKSSGAINPDAVIRYENGLPQNLTGPGYYYRNLHSYHQDDIPTRCIQPTNQVPVIQAGEASVE